MGKLFGTDGVRGIANEKLDVELALAISRAVGNITREKLKTRPKFIVGRDTRLSGEMLESAVAAGLTSVGCDVELLGIVPTPSVAYLVKKLKADGGIMITASHNPYMYNGIKCFGPEGFKLLDAEEKRIEKMILDGAEPMKVAATSEIGRITRNNDAVKLYEEHISSVLKTDLSGMKLLIDCANGASYQTAKEIFGKSGAEIHFVGNEPDGYNVNEKCGSLHIESLGKAVAEGNYDLGIAFDGDADRCIATDEKGNVLDGDIIIAILADRLNKEGKLKGNTIVPTILSNMGLFKFAEKNGLKCIPTKVGDRYVLETMVKMGLNVGGEQSGHVILLDHMTTGDGELTGLLLAESIKLSGKKASEAKKIMEVYPQKMVNMDATQEMKDKLEDPEVKSYLNIMSSRLEGEGRVLVRASGTEPYIRVMCECKDEAKIDSVISECIETLQNML